MTPAAIVLVGLGGAAGSIARYLLGQWTAAAAPQAAFPLGTFAVNLSGCLAVGLLAQRQEWGFVAVGLASVLVMSYGLLFGS